MLSVASCTSLKTGSFPDSLVVSPTSASGSDTLLEVVRSSLDSESWQRNHIWTAKAEWDHRRRGFPLAQDLRWKFAKNWNPARENAESPAPVDVPVAEKQRPAEASSKRSTGDAKKSATKSPATNPKKDSPGDSTVDEAPSTKDAQAVPEQAPQWDGLWPLTIADILRPAAKSSKDLSGAVSPAMDEGVRCLRRLACSNNLVGWNAAILWAQQDPISAVEVADRLQKLIVNPPQYVAETGDGPTNTDYDLSNRFKRGAPKQSSDAANKSGSPNDPGRKIQKTLSTATRCAAAEAWCLVLAVSAADPIDGLAPAGRLLEQTQLPNEIRAELFRGVALGSSGSHPAVGKCLPRRGRAAAASHPHPQGGHRCVPCLRDLASIGERRKDNEHKGRRTGSVSESAPIGVAGHRAQLSHRSRLRGPAQFYPLVGIRADGGFIRVAENTGRRSQVRTSPGGAG